MKPGLKSLAPGTIDNASGSEESVKIGVSCTLWKGTSGGPCILLDGHEAGAIIGHGEIDNSFRLQADIQHKGVVLTSFSYV